MKVPIIAKIDKHIPCQIVHMYIYLLRPYKTPMKAFYY